MVTRKTYRFKTIDGAGNQDVFVITKKQILKRFPEMYASKDWHTNTTEINHWLYETIAKRYITKHKHLYAGLVGHKIEYLFPWSTYENK